MIEQSNLKAEPLMGDIDMLDSDIHLEIFENPLFSAARVGRSCNHPLTSMTRPPQTFMEWLLGVLSKA